MGNYVNIDSWHVFGGPGESRLIFLYKTNKLSFELACQFITYKYLTYWSNPSTWISVVSSRRGWSRIQVRPRPPHYQKESSHHWRSLIAIGSVRVPIFIRYGRMIEQSIGLLGFLSILAGWGNGCIGGKSTGRLSWNESMVFPKSCWMSKGNLTQRTQRSCFRRLHI